MNRKLLVGVFSLILLLGILKVSSVGIREDLTKAREAFSNPRTSRLSAPRFHATPSVDLEAPSLKRPMATYRVRERALESGYSIVGGGYTSEVSADGFRFGGKGHYLKLSTTGLERGDVSQSLPEGRLEKSEYGKFEIHRGPLVEEYVCENTRAEQIYRISEAPGDGALRVRARVETDLSGPVIEVRRADLGWKENPLQDGGLAFTDSSGAKTIAYHGVQASDARGRKIELDAHYQDGEIALEVPAAFMAEATFPILIDPWLELNFSATNGGISNFGSVAQTPAVALGGGFPVVAWAEQVNASQFQIFLVFWNGVAWFPVAGSNSGTGLSQTSGNATNPACAIDSNGNYYVAWEDDSNGGIHEIYFKKYDVTQAKWITLNAANAGQVTSASLGGVSDSVGFSTNPSIALMDVEIPSTAVVDTVPVIAWQSTAGPAGTDAIWVAAFWPGDAGQAPSSGGAATTTQNFPTIPAGWYGLGMGALVEQMYVFRAGGTQGSSFTPPGAVSQRPRIVTLPAPAPISSQGAGVVVTPPNPGTPVKVAPAANAYIAFQDTRTPGSIYDIYALKYTPPLPSDATVWATFPITKLPDFCGGTWAGVATGTANTPDNVSATPAQQSLNPSLAIDSTGIPYIAWEEYLPVPGSIQANSEIFVKRMVGGAWSEVGGSASAGAVAGTGGVSRTLTTSISPSITVDSSNTPFVAWEDDEAGNAEIYVRAFTGLTPWSEVGFQFGSASSANGLGGVSKDFAASRAPAMFGGPSPGVAWQDFTTGNFEIYVRAFYQNQPRQIRQFGLGGAPPIAFGSVTGSTSIELHCVGFSENTARFLRMETEVRPISSPFVGTVTQVSPPLPVDAVSHLTTSGLGVTADLVVVFTGLVNVAYHWMVRTVDDLGQASPWVVANPITTGTGDFQVTAAPAGAPGAPTNLQAALVGNTVALTWNATPGGADFYILNRGLATGTEVQYATNIPLLTFTDAAVTAGTTYFYTVQGSRGGLVSPPSNEVFITPVVAVAAGPADTAGKARCGLMGGELLLVVGALAWIKRRRTR